MEIATNIAVFLGLCTSVGTLFCVTIPGLRHKVGDWFVSKQKRDSFDDRLNRIEEMLAQHVQADADKTEAMKCLLRDSITTIYYKRLPESEIKTYEVEDVTKLFDSYRKLGGNSYVQNIYDQMTSEWRVVK